MGDADFNAGGADGRLAGLHPHNTKPQNKMMASVFTG
jgi:hypothetical protein